MILLHVWWSFKERCFCWSWNVISNLTILITEWRATGENRCSSLPSARDAALLSVQIVPAHKPCFSSLFYASILYSVRAERASAFAFYEWEWHSSRLPIPLLLPIFPSHPPPLFLALFFHPVSPFPSPTPRSANWKSDQPSFVLARYPVLTGTV